jgi:cbb3-type cytochrome oxidase subunit 3
MLFTIGCVVVVALCFVGLVVVCYCAERRAQRWEAAARCAHEDARIWQRIAERDVPGVPGKKTVVAPQYHAPVGAGWAQNR